MRKYVIVQHITRFFWLPSGMRRQPPWSLWRLAGLWLFVLACGAGLTAIDWDDEFDGSHLMALLLLFNVVDDIFQGLRHRWLAALAAVTLLWGASRLTSTALPGSLDEAWAQTIAAAVGVTFGLTASAAITRIPERRPRQPVKNHNPEPGGEPSR
ncbi:hypothetical protein HCJ76_05695 [Streptomyces sp. MC1]|uniref:hypothetical protein n=1 Tax=Streptomyces TaxID=1883 RepID=UPI0018C990C7|nr:hypothetical protein [Streptomyces sp. MC1]MBG7697593.1 hypothetical protein [Streptomyces sp. MC1]